MKCLSTHCVHNNNEECLKKDEVVLSPGDYGLYCSHEKEDEAVTLNQYKIETLIYDNKDYLLITYRSVFCELVDIPIVLKKAKELYNQEFERIILDKTVYSGTKGKTRHLFYNEDSKDLQKTIEIIDDKELRNELKKIFCRNFNEDVRIKNGSILNSLEVRMLGKGISI